MLKFRQVYVFLLSLLIFIVVLDPTNALFHLKEIVYMGVLSLYFFCLRKKIDVKMLTAILLIFIFFSSSLLYGTIGQNDIDYTFSFGILKSFVFLGILLVIAESDNINVMKVLSNSCLIVSIITFIVYMIVLFYPELAIPIDAFFFQKGELIKMSLRSFLGFEVVSVYYKTAAISVIPLSYWYAKYVESRQKKHLLLVAIFALTLWCSGTRANMLSAILLLALFFLSNLKKTKFGIFLFSVLSMAAMCALFLLLDAIFHDQEHSIETKAGHLTSLMNVLLGDLGGFLWGQGAGSLYYSVGSESIIPLSEITYLEILRMFGIFGGSFLIFFYFFPLYLMVKNKPRNYKYIFWGYLAYLFIGGTNPLLISSTGILVLFVAYYYSLRT